MARSNAARARHGVHSSGNITRPKRETGQYGNTRPREDASVRRARQMETDGRLKAAKAAQEKAEADLRALEAKQAQVAEFVERSTKESGVPLKVTDPATLKKVATLLNVPNPTRTPPAAEPDWERLEAARGLLLQGYHVSHVAQRTGTPVTALRRFVANDGYVKKNPPTTTRN